MTDNAIVAFETMHHISQIREGKISEMSLKLDMSEVYDRVEWVRLEKLWRSWSSILDGES